MAEPGQQEGLGYLVDDLHKGPEERMAFIRTVGVLMNAGQVPEPLVGGIISPPTDDPDQLRARAEARAKRQTDAEHRHSLGFIGDTSD